MRERCKCVIWFNKLLLPCSIEQILEWFTYDVEELPRAYAAGQDAADEEQVIPYVA
jgi:hypothetical protein